MLPNDELNIPSEYENKLTDYQRYFEEYFRPMEISDSQKEKRKDAADRVRDVLIFLLLLMREMADNFDYDYVLNVFRIEFQSAVSAYSRMDDYMESYVNRFTESFLDHTIEHLSKNDASYFMSEDRATVASANEANSIIGYEELQTAKDNGYTHKVWVSQRDNRVRRTHQIADGQKKPIDDYFIVGGVALMIPCDPDCDVEEETSGCRCVCHYTK